MGTFLLVLLGPGALVIVSSVQGLSPVEALVLVALAFGATVGMIIVVLGKHSGAHINPAITIASTIAGFSARRQLAPYVAFQVAGALIAGLALRLVFSTDQSSLGATKLAGGVSPTEGFLLEVGGTFFLALAALTAGSRLSSAWKQAALVGSTLFLLILMIGPLTGASFNPARSLGPSIFSGYLTGQAVYWFGPVIGGALAGYLFSVFWRRKASA